MQSTWNPKGAKGAGKLDKCAKQAATRQQKGAGEKGAKANGDRKVEAKAQVKQEHTR